MLTSQQLARVMSQLPAAKAALYLPPLNAAMAEFGIDNAARTAAFIAQLAHESGQFRWMEEIWGPTDAQRRYEPPSDLAKRLGNTQAGDGARYKGRGPIQLTGRANYARFGPLLGVDLVAAPERAAQPDVAFRIAALFWKSHGLNELADAGDFVGITRRINGGTNGLADRQAFYAVAQKVLAEGFVAGVTRGAVMPKPFSAALEPLARGAEALAAPAKKTAAGKAPAKKAAAKKVPAKKAPAKKAPAKKVTAKTTVAKKPPAKTGPVKTAAAKKAAAKKAPAKKAAAKKAPAKKAPVKRAAR